MHENYIYPLLKCNLATDSLSLSFSLFFSFLPHTHTQLHSCQEMLSTQLQNAVVELLSMLLSKDFAHLEKLKENLEASSQGIELHVVGWYDMHCTIHYQEIPADNN